MSIALSIALFLPDLMVCAGHNNNTETDIILTVVMFLFAFEFFGLCATDPAYLFGFFFCMDIVGTVSMAFDISFMFGSDATQPIYSSSGDAKKNLMLLRAARAAKLGARAGRLSRVLKILRFLPFMRNNEKSEVQMARVISNQLSNLLATRVACLTILLVVIIPIFSLVTFPEDDMSMQTWTERLSSWNEYKKGHNATSFAAEQADLAFKEEIQEFSTFYDALQYGPYKACFGAMVGDEFVCDDTRNVGLKTDFEEPSRGSSKLILHTDGFMAAFNMFNMNALESALGMVLILVVVFVMAFAGMALSNVVNDLAVKPMERMLVTVRSIAKTVFKFSAEQAEEEDSDDDLDEIEDTTEMQLLEKVVNKLATLAEISTKKQPDFDKDNMGAEDLGVLNMMGGQETKDSSADTLRKSQLKRQTTMAMKVDEVGISMDTWQSWIFNPLNLTKDQQKALTAWAVYNHQGCSTFARDSVPDAKMQSFVSGCESSYLANPYHNYAHALDVVHTASRVLKTSHAELFLTEIEQFSVLIGGIGHDLGHPGVNNPFLIEASHELALRYNDKSPLENMHCSKLFTLCANADSNIFASMARDQYREIRRHCIEMILHTDMVQHFAMVKELAMLYQMNSDMFDATEIADLETMQDPNESELLRQGDNKKLVMNLILHSGDVSNPYKSWGVCEAWAYMVLDEFFAQGDQEKMLGLPVQMLNDRDKVNKPNSQIGFIEFVVAPLIAAQVRLFPTLWEIGENIGANLEHWENVWINQHNPSDEDKGKVRNRVAGVQTKMEDARYRGHPPPQSTPGGAAGRKQAFN